MSTDRRTKKYFVVGHYGEFSSPVHLDAYDLKRARGSLAWQRTGQNHDCGIYTPHPTKRGHMVLVEGNPGQNYLPEVEVSGGGWVAVSWAGFIADNWEEA